MGILNTICWTYNPEVKKFVLKQGFFRRGSAYFWKLKLDLEHKYAALGIPEGYFAEEWLIWV